MNNQNNLSFGRYLKKIRTEKGISLDAVSAETRIAVGNLIIIENEDHNRLPENVFVKGFLRAYAKAIGADGEEAIRLYLSSAQDYEKKTRYEKDLTETGSKFWSRFLLALGALFGMIVLTTGVVSKLEEQHASQAESIHSEKAIVKNDIAVEKQANVSESLRENTRHTPEKLLLDVRAVEKTWMKIQVDEQVPREYSLKPGERLALEAIAEIRLHIGNAGGVRLKLNDKPVTIRGKSGQVVKVHLPGDSRTE